MKYEIRLTIQTQNFLKKLDKSNQIKIRDKLKALIDNPKSRKPLTASLAGLWSLRINKYRIIYQIIN